MTTPGAASGAGTGAEVTGIQFTTALEQLTTAGVTAGNQNILSIQPDQHGGNIITTVSSVGANFTNGSQQALHHVDPSSISFHHQQPIASQPQPHELLQQPGGSIAHSNTVIIQQPLMEDIITTTATNQQSGTTVTTLLESQGVGQFPHPSHQQHQLHVHLEQSGQQQLVSTATNGHGGQTVNLHQIVHHVLVDPSTVDPTGGTGGHYQLGPGAGGGDGGVASPVIQSDPAAQYSTAGATGSLEGGEAGGGVVFSLEGLPTSSTYS